MPSELRIQGKKLADILKVSRLLASAMLSSWRYMAWRI
jgi:hypothetical protein